MSNKRQHIIEEAFRIIYQRGYNGTGINEIVKAAGVPKGSFYYYFENKEQLAVETVHFYKQMMIAEMTGILAETAVSPLQRLHNLYQNRVDAFANRWDYALGCYAGNLSLEMGDVSEPIREVLDFYFSKSKEIIAACIKEGQDAGEISTRMQAEDLAEFMINSYEGAMLRMKTSKNMDAFHVLSNVLDALFKQT